MLPWNSGFENFVFVVFTYTTYWDWGFDEGTHRMPLSLPWVAGAFDRNGRYGTPCGA
jgi:hypothetical protein